MNNIVNKFLLAGDKFNPELHVRQPGFTYIACEPFLEHCERTEKLRETGQIKHLYRNKLDKFYFAHNTSYSDSNDFAKKTISDKILKDRAY